jgi:hypothetical protein
LLPGFLATAARHDFPEIRGTYLKELVMDWNTTLGLTLLSVAAGLMLGRAMAQTDAPSAVTLTPVEMKWKSQGALAAPELEQLNLIGDPAKAGPYTLRLRFSKEVSGSRRIRIRIRARSRPVGRVRNRLRRKF